MRLWGDRLAGLPRPRSGLCWRGSPADRGAGARDDPRFIPLPLLEEAFTGIEASLVSLQRDAARRQIAAFPRVFDPKSDPAYGVAALEDFADTAALLANLDLLISVDTANVHLAGALGRPAYLLLPFTADWRWLEGREDSPWYSSLRLLRPAPRGLAGRHTPTGACPQAVARCCIVTGRPDAPCRRRARSRARVT